MAYYEIQNQTKDDDLVPGDVDEEDEEEVGLDDEELEGDEDLDDEDESL